MSIDFITRLTWQWVEAGHITTLHQLEETAHHYARVYALSPESRASVLARVTQQFTTRTKARSKA